MFKSKRSKEWNCINDERIMHRVQKCHYLAYDNEIAEIPLDACEQHLPLNSALRFYSKPWKDYQMFIDTLEFEFWADNFVKSVINEMTNNVAKSIVQRICLAQSTLDLRSLQKPSSRELNVPISRVLHELKDWCVTQLRVITINDLDECITRRVTYLDYLKLEEVWGKRQPPNKKLFTLFNAICDELHDLQHHFLLVKEHEEFNKHLNKAQEVLKDLLFSELIIFSKRFDLSAKSQTLKIEDLFKYDSIDFIDMKNIVNVMLIKLFQDDFIRFCLNGENKVSNIKDRLDNWRERNVFCYIVDNKAYPLLQKDKTKVMPQIYSRIVSEFREKLKDKGVKGNKLVSPRKAFGSLRMVFSPDVVISAVLQELLVCLSALYEVIPSFYYLNEISVTDDKSERDKLLRAILVKVETLQNSSEKFTAFLNARYKETAERLFNKNTKKKGKPSLRPVWMSNHKFSSSELEHKSTKLYKSFFKAMKALI